MSLSRKTSRTLYISQRYKKNWCSADSVRLSLIRETAKRCVFSRRLKVPSVCDAVTLDGKLFQTRGAATKKARLSIVERRDDCVTTAEGSGLLASMPATRHSSFARYGGAIPCRQRNTSTASLNSIRSCTGNQ